MKIQFHPIGFQWGSNQAIELAKVELGYRYYLSNFSHFLQCVLDRCLVKTANFPGDSLAHVEASLFLKFLCIETGPFYQ
jgi:hypothetical protein